MGFNLSDAVFYHIYALGTFGAPRHNGPGTEGERLAQGISWLDEMDALGGNVLLIGPLFESESHGYDTTDYFRVDRRLGSNGSLAKLVEAAHERGIAVVLDAVLNHVGRGHPIIRDLVERGAASPYTGWIRGFDASREGRGGLPFDYEGWKGHYDLVAMDTSRAEVRDYLIAAVESWIKAYSIDGLRLDAADCLDRGFLAALASRCKELDPAFVTLGEAVHGDLYAPILGAGVDSVTNYEAWKSLWSSCVDRNFHEIAWTLDRLFAPGGLCEGKSLYSFADNHDVDRVASLLGDKADLYPLYALLFAMPGSPSIYYGSERGLEGRKEGHDDGPLRPALEAGAASDHFPQPDLRGAISRFAAARATCPALRRGAYRKLTVGARSLAFERALGERDRAVVAINQDQGWTNFDAPVRGAEGLAFRDLLDGGFRAKVDRAGRLRFETPPHWARYLVPEGSFPAEEGSRRRSS